MSRREEDATLRKNNNDNVDNDVDIDEDEDEDLEWDVTKTTKTAWSAAIRPAIQRTRRAFGSRQTNNPVKLSSSMASASTGAGGAGSAEALDSSVHEPPSLSSSSSLLSFSSSSSTALDLQMDAAASSFLKPRRRASANNITAGDASFLFSETLPEEPLPFHDDYVPPPPVRPRKFQLMTRRAHTVPITTTTASSLPLAALEEAAAQQPASSSSRLVAPPPKPNRRRMTRSHSMALGGSSPCAFDMAATASIGSSASASSALRRQLLGDLPSSHELRSYSSSANADSSIWNDDDDENCGPNRHRHDDEGEEIMEESNGSSSSAIDLFSSKGRRKIARRASIQCFSPSVVEDTSGTSYTGNVAGQQQQNTWIPPPRLFAAASAESGSTAAAAAVGGGGDLAELLSGTMATSSPAPSVCSSSRKRGVCGSPISDTLDECCWSTGGLSASMNSSSSLSVRRSRSRSRIFSSSHSSSSTTNNNSHNNNGSSNNGSTSCLQPSLFYSNNNNMGPPLGDDDCRGMEIDTDDDTTSDVDTSHDISFTSATGGSESHHSCPVGTIATNNDGKQQQENKEHSKNDSIFEQMSSLNDLKFLINALRKENTTQYISNSWTVVPGTKWPAQRRSAFFQWLVHHLEFSIRPLGNSVNVLQISKAKGASLLQSLEAAFETQKMQQQQQETVRTKQQHEPEPEPNNGAFSFVVDVAGSSVQKHSAPQPSFGQSLQPVSHFDAMLQGDADNLATGLQSLTVNDKNTQTLRESDASIPSSVSSDPLSAMHHYHDSSSRPSFDHSVLDGRDMMHHMVGGGPDSPGHGFRPPKMSMASTVSSVATFRGRGSSVATYQTAAPTNTTHHFETPQIKQDEGWGSRPVAGRDWGNSCACDAANIQELEELLEESCRLAGNYFPCDDTKNIGLPFMPLPCLEFEIKRRPPEGRGSLASMEEVSEEPEALMRDSDQQEKLARRQRISLAKHRRMSLWTSAAQDSVAILPERNTIFFPRGANTLAPVEEPMTASLSTLGVEFPTRRGSVAWDMDEEPEVPSTSLIHDERILSSIFGFLKQNELLCTASLVCRSWANAATTAHANMMMASIGYVDRVENDDEDIEGDNDSETFSQYNSVSLSMAKDWRYLTNLYPWGCYLSAGTFKKVFKVHNTKVGRIEAVSVMDIEPIKDKKVVAAELMVSVLLSSLARRGVCPNFILTRGVFTSGYAPPESHWGSMENKKPKGATYNAKKVGRPGKPRGDPEIGRFQLIRMELCSGGDLEEYLKVQPDKILECDLSRAALFQIAFALHAGASRFSLKHYDMKLLNIFVQKLEASSGDVVLRYGLGAHVFALRMHWDKAFIAKLADYGTANVRSESNGQPVTIAQFTTLENTPPDFMILGDLATQGHGHDNWGLGLCMLHLFTGHKPYEEIMADVTCPPMLRKKLKKVWENDGELGYTAIRSVILTDVYKDDSGHIIDGEPDETLYETLYRYLVLFGIPKGNFQDKKRPKVWKAIRESLEGVVCKKTGRGRKQGTDVDQFHRDRSLYSIEVGGNDYIKDARERLQQMEGGMDLLLSLCAFDPARRATALQVLNSPFMKGLREEPNATYGANDHVQSFTAFSTNR